ncbi:unnamed protein product [Orchesella dallaii]|uniref:DNA repair protein XRCC3 n=1 Tax=Orchesella dallaii TaxID=48710 RepID=A0ABP1Q5D0_9HEXA
MDHDTNIYSEPLLPLTQGYLPSPGSSGPSQKPQQSTTKASSVSVKRSAQQAELESEASEAENEFKLEDLVVRASDLSQNYCTTGCRQLDHTLRGGIPTFGITELYGEGGAGKTQICLQLSITAQLAVEAGGLNTDVLYICTEDAFPSKRLAELILNFQSKFANALPSNPMSHIYIERALDAEALLQCVSIKLPNFARTNLRKIRLVVLDSVAAIFRSELEDISRRTSELRRLGQSLHEFSQEHSAAVVICNQVSANPSSCERNVASLGMAWKNMVKTRIRVSKSEDHSRRYLEVSFSPHIPPSNIPIQVFADGVRGDSYEKEFIYRHSGTIFQLIDADASGQISSAEFSHMGVLFNFDHSAIKRIFNEFDISGDKNLDFSEFRLFTMACIDEARAQETREKVKAFAKYRERLLLALEPSLRRFVRTDRLPRPREIEETVVRVRHPYIPGRKDVGRPFRYAIIRQIFKTTREEIRDYFKERFEKIPCLFCFFGYILCCYCCIEDPLENTGGRTCRCKCKCRCLPCWFAFVRKLLTCCYCIFPCCHCCQPLHDHYQHIARKAKMKWPEPTDSDEETELVNGQPQRGFHHHYHAQHYRHKSNTDVTNHDNDPAAAGRERNESRPSDTKSGAVLKNSGNPDTQEALKRRKMKPTPQPVENPRWCRTQ